MSKGSGLWKPADATHHINRCASDDRLQLSWKLHAKERMRERDILMGDVLHLLRNGFVLEAGVASTREGYFRYQVEGTTPNSHARSLCVVVIPDPKTHELKIVTIMWRDER